MNGFQAYGYMDHREGTFEAGSLWPGVLLWIPTLLIGSLLTTLL